MKSKFNEFRFDGLEYKELKYFTMNRVSKDETRIVVRVNRKYLFKTKYGFALILDEHHVCFLKEWQLNINYTGCEVLLSKEFFVPKAFGSFPEFKECEQNLLWETWLNGAKKQDEYVDKDGQKIFAVVWQKEVRTGCRENHQGNLTQPNTRMNSPKRIMTASV